MNIFEKANKFIAFYDRLTPKEWRDLEPEAKAELKAKYQKYKRYEYIGDNNAQIIIRDKDEQWKRQLYGDENLEWPNRFHYSSPFDENSFDIFNS